MRLTVNDLNVPPSTRGEDAVAELTRDRAGSGGRTYRAVVTDATPTADGKIGVRVDQRHTQAKLRSTAKAVRQGDNIEVVKTGGHWHVVASETWHEPPAVSGSMGNPPSNAATASTTTLRTPNSRPDPPNYPSSSSNGDLYFTLNQVVIFLRSANYNWTGSVNNAISDLRSAVNSTRSTVNTNASRLNQARDYASNAGQLVEPVVGALRDEGIVR